MKATQKLSLVLLLVLLVAVGIGLYFTAQPAPSGPAAASPAASSPEAPVLNRRFLDSVLNIASTATTREEQAAAKAALDAADHDLDLQYAYALQLAALEPVPQTPQIHSTQQRIARIEAAIQTRQAEVEHLQSALKSARGARRADLQDQLDVSQAELNLFQEALTDAKDDLDQEGGDPASRLQALKAEHQAASDAVDKFKFPPLRTTPSLGSLLDQWSYWKSVQDKEVQIQGARREALVDANQLASHHDAIEKRLAAEEAQRKAIEAHELTESKSAGAVAARPPQPAPPGAKSSAVSQRDAEIALFRKISSDRVMERILDHRTQSINDLLSAWQNWKSVVELEERSVLHGLIAGGLWLVLLMALAFFLNRAIEHFFVRLTLDRKQKSTLEAVLRISVRLIIVVVILMIIFGTPEHLSTVLGLAGAGMAVALQDFILSFMGWFVLMGRHGMHVGDWVEINQNAFNGVRGEVVEITLFRTVLLETGNWTEAGHLTGRKVAFMNMYAVSGYYFNFTTAGQWLWDELQVAVPAGENPYPLIEKIQAIVVKETESQVDQAELEWTRLSHRYGMKLPSAQPSVSLKPTESGVIAVIRHITRADERTATRSRLNREIARLFHQGEKLVAENQPVEEADSR